MNDYNEKLAKEYQVAQNLRKDIEELKERIAQLEQEKGKLNLQKEDVEILLKEEKDKTKKMNELAKILNDA